MIFKDYLDGLRGKRIVIIGAGVSNIPLIEALLFVGIDLTICDKKSREELGEAARRYEENGAKMRLGETYLDDLKADLIFRTPGLMPWNPKLLEAVKNGAVLTSEMEVFLDICPCKIVGITGTNGKTTTTSIIGEILLNAGKSVHIGGNIGVPLLSIADTINQDDIAVLELSSFQLISMRKSPHISIVTNLSPNHLDVHKDMIEYAHAKRNIVAYQNSFDKAVLNYDNTHTRAYAEYTNAQVSFFSRQGELRDGVYLDGETICESVDGQVREILAISNIRLPGAHNVENFMAAILAVQGLADINSIVKTAQEFKGVKHRIEFVAQFGGVSYYNDSIATTPSRSIAALKAFEQKVILIAGGKGKGLSYDELADVIVKRAKAVILVGAEAQAIRSAIINTSEYNDKLPIMLREGLESAVNASVEIAQVGDVVLFSPACSSFDMFRNFEERGEAFKDIVCEVES